MRKTTWIHKALCGVSLLLQTIWLFFPALIFLALAMFAFWMLPQGRDLIRLCLEGKNFSGLVFMLATVFWVFVTWYTGRLIAYNHSGLFDTRIVGTNLRFGEFLLYHFPRLMAYSIFMVLIIALIFYDDAAGERKGWRNWLIVLEYVFYIGFHLLFEKIGVMTLKGRHSGGIRRLHQFRHAVTVVIVTACGVSLAFWGQGHLSRVVLIISLAIVQLGFLFLVITRRQATVHRIGDDPDPGPSLLDRFLLWVIGDRRPKAGLDARTEAKIERRIFRLFNVISALSLLSYFIAIFYMPFARLISPMPFVFLAFGVLLGASCLISLLSHRSKVNYYFVIIFIVFIAGCFTEPHRVRLRNDAGVSFKERMEFRAYLDAWMADPVRRDQLAGDTGEYPVFLVLADGGASRSGYWTALVLSHLDSSTAASTAPGAYAFRDHLFCLSGASGGSVGNGAYLAALKMASDSGAGPDIRRAATDYLDADFLSFTLARMLGPDLFSPLLWWLFGGDRAAALEQSIEQSPGATGMNAAVQDGFSSYLPVPGRAFLPPIICINTTRMQDGQPGVIANVNLDSVTKGNRLDVLDSLPGGADIRLSSCMVLGARFPYVSPAGRIGNQYFVDGGYFDNSGAGIVHEMLLELRKIQSLDTVSGSPLSKLRFYVLHITNSPYSNDRLGRVHAVKNDLLAPLLTLAGSYATQTDVNDTRLNSYIDGIYGEKSHISVNLYLKNKRESFPMNWVISREMRVAMEDRVRQPAIDSIIVRLQRGDRNIYRGLDEQSAPDSNTTRPLGPAN